MSGGKTKNAALTTVLAFHYQMLIGLDKCFSLEDGESILFETDGDVSLLSSDVRQSVQIEVKDYTAPLTDNHENLWKTLKNWLAPEFDHTQYGALVLQTTQAFGKNTRLKDWNSQSALERLSVLKNIFNDQNLNQFTGKQPSGVFRFQKEVMEERTEETLLSLVGKVLLNVETDDLNGLRKQFCRKLEGFIPSANQQAFVEGLIGYVYEQAEDNIWIIDKSSFKKMQESLTAKWGPALFTVPDFVQRNASEDEIETYTLAVFAKKIIEIQYDEVLPEAIGSWLELRNVLFEEFHGNPQFMKTVSNYRDQLASKFLAKYRIARRKTGCHISISQDLYDNVIGETPSGINGYPNPDLVFKNGLIHEIMDDDKHQLKWAIKP